MRDAGRIASVFADRTKSTDFLTICRSRSRGVDNRGEMVSHPTFQESWGMLVDMNFKVGDQLPRRVPKCLGRSSFGHSFRDFEICLVQLAEDGVDAFLQTRELDAHRTFNKGINLFVKFTPDPLIRV